jgi:hypothetical protein
MLYGAVVLAMCLVSGAFAQAGENAAVEPLGFHTAAPLKLEPVGQASVKAWYRTLTPGRADDRSPWKQLIWFKKDSRTTQKSCFAVADFDAGVLRELPTMIPAMEVSEGSRWVEGKYYLGTNLPARLVVFDPATDTLTDLGPCFADNSLTCFRVEVSPDGMLVLAAAQGSDVSLYDPRTRQFTHFGQVAAEPGGGTYAYYVSADEKYIYVAVRSSDPWELVRLDRTTKERRVLLTAPAQCHMAINGNLTEVSGQGPKKRYTLADGQAVELATADQPQPWSLPGPGFSGTPPGIAIDLSPIVVGEETLTVHVQSPDGRAWRATKLPLRLDVANIGGLAAMEDGRLVGVPGAYFAMVIVDPATGVTQRVPMQVSMYGMLPVGKRIFISGYPSGCTMVFDTGKPMTWEEDLPNRAGVKSDSPAANPKLLRYFGQDTGGAHIGMLLTKGADGNVYMIARRHRYFFGFALLWFHPEPNENGEQACTVFDDGDAFHHLQVSAMHPVDGGKQLLISTQVQYNKQLPGEPPKSAAVFLFDVAEKRIVGRYEPLPGARSIAAAIMTGPETIIGSADNYVKPGTGTLFRYNTRTGRLEQTRHVDWNLGGTMTLQPDGKLWGSVLYGNFAVIFTLDPKDLGTKALGRTEDARSIGLCFQRGELYLSGYPTIMKAKGGF